MSHGVNIQKMNASVTSPPGLKDAPGKESFGDNQENTSLERGMHITCPEGTTDGLQSSIYSPRDSSLKTPHKVVSGDFPSELSSHR